MPCQRAVESVLPHRLHALLHGHLLQGAGRHLLEDGVAKNFIDDDHFRDRRSSVETSLQALLAAGPAPEGCGGQRLRRDEFQKAALGLVRLSTVGAILSNEPDAEHPNDA